MRFMTTRRDQECDAYILDTCKISATGKYLPGAITFRGRKKIEAMSWKDKQFDSQHEADEFVRAHFRGINLPEAVNEGEIASRHPNW